MSTRVGHVLVSYADEIDRLFDQFGFDDSDAREAFEKRVFDVFRESVHVSYCGEALNFLRQAIPKQEDRANLVGLSRPAWSRVESKQRMKKEHLEYISHKFRHELRYPPLEELSHRAALKTISHIQKKELRRGKGTHDLTREEYEFLFEIVLNDQWKTAITGDSVTRLVSAFEQISSRIAALPFIEISEVTTFGMLVHLSQTWFDAFLLGISTIPYEA
jgi:hypothetical protein